MLNIYLDRILDPTFLLFAVAAITGFVEYAKPAIIRARLPGILKLLRLSDGGDLSPATYEIAVRLLCVGAALVLLLGLIRPNWYGAGDVWENFTRNLPTAGLFVVAAFGLMFVSDVAHRLSDRAEGRPGIVEVEAVDAVWGNQFPRLTEEEVRAYLSKPGMTF